MDRAKFIDRQQAAIDELVGLTDDAEAWRPFQALCVDTYDFLKSMGDRSSIVLGPWPESAFNPLSSAAAGVRGDGTWIQLSPELRQRWQAWNDEYYEIRKRSPRLELRDTMQDISESHDASSWPAGYERHIQRWVDAGDPSAKPPFDDRYGIVTREFFARLQELRRRRGGWLYADDRSNRLVFLPELEWQTVSAKQDAARAQLIGRYRDIETRLDVYATRLAKVVATAKADVRLWDALRRWELEREASRPSKLPTSYVVSDTESSASRAIDPIFTDFFTGLADAMDGMSAHDVVMYLRTDLRAELGLDQILTWQGGPGLALCKV